MIDEDPDATRPSDISKFEIIKEEHNLIWKQKSNTKHILIVVCPRVEEWLYSVAKTASIDPTQRPYSLPKSAKILHDEFTAKRNVNENRNVMSFLTDVVSKNPPQIQTLRNWLQEIQAL